MNNLKNLFKIFKDKENTVIISRFCTCLISLVLLIMAIISYAWFSLSREVSSDSVKLAIKIPDDIVVTATVHDCIGQDNNGVYYFNKNAAVSNNLKKYMLLQKNNRQLLLRIHFEDPDTVEGISFTASTETTYFMGDGEHPLLASMDGKGTEYDNVLSSIIAFYVVSSEETTFETNDAYKVASLGTPNNFIDKNDYSITNLLTLVNKQAVSDIYIVIDYDPLLVTKVFSENLGNGSFKKDDGSFLDEVFYVWDIDFELSRD